MIKINSSKRIKSFISQLVVIKAIHIVVEHHLQEQGRKIIQG